MSDAVPPRSVPCTRDDHAGCPHVAGFERISLRRLRTRTEPMVSLCDCGCHAECPLAGRSTARQGVWRQDCTCSGAVPLRQTQERSEQLRRELAAVMAEARREGPLDARDVERRIRAVFEAHGEQPPPLTGWSRVAAAATARRGTRTARLLGMGGRAVVGSVRWAWQPVGSPGDNRGEVRKGYRSVAAVAGAAVTMTVAAGLSTGRRRLLWVSGAAVTWLAAGWATVSVTAAAQISRVAERHGPDAPARTAPD